MARGIGQQVVQNLHDAPPVGHHAGQVWRKVDEHGLPVAAAQERRPRPVTRHLHTGETLDVWETFAEARASVDFASLDPEAVVIEPDIPLMTTMTSR